MQWCAWSDSRVESVQVLQVRQHLEEALAVAVHFSDRTVEEVEVAQVRQRALRASLRALHQRLSGSERIGALRSTPLFVEWASA